MENCEEVLQILDRFSKIKPTVIPKELEDYLCYVARTGDTVFRWSNIKQLFKEKIIAVMKEFHETSASVEELPQYPNVDPFNFEAMKSTLLERLELFNAAPFTVQRLCELLTDPRRQYTRIDKFMRALEKNILVVSTTEPGRRVPENENSESSDSAVNGDLSSDVNVKIDVNGEPTFEVEKTRAIGTSSMSETTTDDDSKRPDASNTGVDDNEKFASNNIQPQENPAKDDDTSSLVKTESNTPGIIQTANNIRSSNEDSKPFEKTLPQFSEKYSACNEKFNNLDVSQTKTELDLCTSVNSNTLSIFPNEPTNSLKSTTDANELFNTVKQEDTNEGEAQSCSNASNSSAGNLVPRIQSDEISTQNESKALSPGVENAESNETSNHEAQTQKETNEDSKLKPESLSEDVSKDISSKILIEKKLNKSQELMAIEEVSTTASSCEVYSSTPDQPMDDNLDTVKDVEVNTCLNGAIMHSETDMVTDIQMSKTDSSVMEIDDTSQEAMDQ